MIAGADDVVGRPLFDEPIPLSTVSSWRHGRAIVVVPVRHR